jgi:LDH2 family malate/lactate/ureidoglycolate dehydrogenase
MIGIVSTNGSPNMPPWGGVEKLFGTLPLAVAIPAREEPPVVLDIAMGVVSKGKILLAARKGEQIPPGWGVDASGHPTTDPAEVLDGGWTQPIGEHKGSGLIFILEVLNGLLTGSGVADAIGDLYGDPALPQNLGHLVIVIDVTAFVERDDFERSVDTFVRLIRSSRVASGHEALLLPGDRERLEEELAAERGVLVSAETLDELRRLGREVGVQIAALDGT